jgi:hypothetical protein
MSLRQIVDHTKREVTKARGQRVVAPVVRYAQCALESHVRRGVRMHLRELEHQRILDEADGHDGAPI